MKILYIGEKKTYELYKKGMVPSHWLYGAIEMSLDGHDVIWEQEKSDLFNDIQLIRRYRPDIVFIPNLNLRNHVLLLALNVLLLKPIKIFAYLHRGVSSHSYLKILPKKILLKSVAHIFFLSEKSMNETIDSNILPKNKCSVPNWGPDLDFYKKVETSDMGYFVSTGKENRDFEILIEAFIRTGEPLKIITAKSHSGNDYTWLEERCKSIANIEVIITENTGMVYPYMLDVMAKAKAIVCPLQKDKLSYCVGLSTIADAEGLCKPLIITENPYHSIERTKNLNVVTNLDDWLYAIMHLSNITTSTHNMGDAFINMRKYMFIED